MEVEMAKRKTYSASFKAKAALEAIKGEQTVAELAARRQIHPALATKWKKQAVEGMAETFSGGGRPAGEASQEARIKELHAKIGELTVERDFLAKAFGR
jgi:transposase